MKVIVQDGFRGEFFSGICPEEYPGIF